MASSSAPPSPGAAGTRRRRPWWLWLLIALVVLALLILALVQCGPGRGGTEDGGSGAAATSAPPAGGEAGSGTDGTGTGGGTGDGTGDGTGTGDGAGAGSGGAAGGAAAGAGTITAGSTALLPVSAAGGANGELTGLAGQAVTATGVAVQSVPSDEGFWLGTSETDRVWVQLTEVPGESPFQVEPGALVDLTGSLTAHDGTFAQQVGVDAAEGADQLTRQAAHVEVPAGRITLDAG